MIERIELVNIGEEVLVLSLRDDGSGYSVEDVKGLDPVRANLITSDLATVDGVQDQASSLDPRNIILTIGMENTVENTVKELRHQLYGFFMPKSPITIRFVDDDDTIVQITGRIETFVAPLFAKEPTATITVLCFDPAFYSPASYTMPAYTTSGIDETNIPYGGTLESGFKFKIELDRPVSELTIYQKDSSGFIRSMEIVYPFQTNDILDVSTVPNEKAITVTRDGIRNSILYSLASGHAWGALQQGGNTIRVSVTGEPIQYTITYYEKFGGL